MITSLQHPLVKHLIRLRDSSDYRSEQRRVLIQGSKMVHEVAQTTKVYRILTTGVVPPLAAEELIHVSESILTKISGVISSDGLVAEVAMPSWDSVAAYTRVLALDAISDPGNLGTLIRTALAFGWEAIYLLQGCCDPFNDKALRAAMGATFKLTLDRGDAAQLHALAMNNAWHTLVADLQGRPPGPLKGPILLVLGNEAKGPSEAIKTFCQPVTLPMQGDIESLNVAVAGGVLMYHYRYNNCE